MINELLSKIAESQDNNTLVNADDIYSKFIIAIVEENTDDNGIVDLEQLEMDFRYAIHQFKRAHDVVERCAD